MKIILNLGIVPVTVKNIAVIQEHYPQLWNDFVLAESADDLPFLLNSFAQEPPAVRSAFLDYAGTHADSIADAAEQTQLIPVEVYAACLNELTEDQLLILRPYLADKNFEIVCTENKKPKFPNTPEVRAIRLRSLSLDLQLEGQRRQTHRLSYTKVNLDEPRAGEEKSKECTGIARSLSTAQ